MTIRTRFAPSPTGYLHIGGARTALYCWLEARHRGGEFILRIEDTDRERSTEAAVQAILDGMHWLGLDADEGPYYQTLRMDRYRAVAEDLLRAGKAYYAYESKDDIEAMRNAAIPNPSCVARPPGHRPGKENNLCYQRGNGGGTRVFAIGMNTARTLFDWAGDPDPNLTKTLHDHIIDTAFPCVGAKAALARGTLEVLTARGLTTAWDDVRIHDRLLHFAAAYRREPKLFRSLAVVFEGERLADAEMQAVAREMNCSETTFLMAPTRCMNSASA